MGTLSNQTLGVLFLATSTASTVLMYYLWGFPFDKERLKSEAPRSLMLLHRMLGYVYVAIYIYLMWQMVPRMWSYQVELPARTVAHLTAGLTIGALLLAKVAVVRFFKHLESALVPALGTALFVATVVLIGLTLPFSLRETLLQRAALRGEVFSQERLDRVRRLLPITGLDDKATLARLATTEGLMSGRAILRTKCVQCHDLRTILARPRTPDGWRQTVRRMAQRSTVLKPDYRGRSVGGHGLPDRDYADPAENRPAAATATDGVGGVSTSRRSGHPVGKRGSLRLDGSPANVLLPLLTVP